MMLQAVLQTSNLWNRLPLVLVCARCFPYLRRNILAVSVMSDQWWGHKKQSFIVQTFMYIMRSHSVRCWQKCGSGHRILVYKMTPLVIACFSSIHSGCVQIINGNPTFISTFQALEDHERDAFLEQKLWISENFKVNRILVDWIIYWWSV